MLTVLVVVLLILLIAGAPTWPHSREWGWGPSGLLTLIIVIILLLWLFGRL
jgi:Na+/melibiose symporter-like transporter